MVRTTCGSTLRYGPDHMSTLSKHLEVAQALMARISGGEIAQGERLPSERDLQAEFGVARSVVRQALAGLVRDGWIANRYPRGYEVIGPRIPWISRLRATSSEEPRVEIVEVRDAEASREVAEALEIAPGDPTVERVSRLFGAGSGETWGRGLVSYPIEGLSEKSAAKLRSPGEITYDDLQEAFRRRIQSFPETIEFRRPNASEREEFDLGRGEGVIQLRRRTLTSARPISYFRFRAPVCR